jgi:peptidoglycan-N-acetylglucosamine deacetylase
MRLYRPVIFWKWLYPGALFRVKTDSRKLYLTFDDGPSPDSTPLILDILEKHNVTATFFCNGKEAERYPEMPALIASKGHAIGNHGYLHLNGCNSSINEYIRNAFRADGLTSAFLFRPPYGCLRLRQYLRLAKKYKIVFWDLMPYDFDRKISGEKVLNIMKKKVRPGSIIVLHDKTSSSVVNILAPFIKYAENAGYGFSILI